MKFKLTYFLLCSIAIGFAQPTIRFSKQYHFFDSNAATSSYVSVNAFTVNNDYLLCGIVNTPTLNQGLGIVRVDSVGTINYQKQFNSPNTLRFTNNTANQAFIKLKNNNVLFTGQYELGLDYSSACMVRVNHNTGDTLWTKMYKQPGDTTYLLCSTELQDSSIISFGFRYYESSTLYSKPFMMKVDKNGTYKWHKWINTTWNNNNTLFLYQKIIKIHDNDFITVGVKNNGALNGFILRIDTNAVKQYEVNTNVLGFNNHELVDFIQLQDGTYLACGVFYTTSGKTKKLVYNFNGATGAKLKHQLYNKEANISGIVTLVQKPNGEILLGGHTGATMPINTINNSGDVLWVNSNLDSLKSIYITKANPADQAGPNQLILTPDGGFAANIGSYTFGSALQQKFWLLKADSNGCYTSTCSLVGINNQSIEYQNFTIYPNPANDIINITCDINNAETYTLTLTNTLGQEVLREAIYSQQSQISIHHLKSGVYQLKLVNNYQQQTFKLIKQ